MPTVTLDNKFGVDLFTMMALDDVSYMRQRANQLAQYLYDSSTQILGVELFGSLSRGQGTRRSDFDMILIVSDATATSWLRTTTGIMLGVDSYNGPSAARVRRAEALARVGIDPADLREAYGIVPWKQDFFLFPLNWRDRCDELQRLGRNRDPNFMQNIATDAITFVPRQGFPYPVIPR